MPDFVHVYKVQNGLPSTYIAAMLTHLFPLSPPPVCKARRRPVPSISFFICRFSPSVNPGQASITSCKSGSIRSQSAKQRAKTFLGFSVSASFSKDLYFSGVGLSIRRLRVRAPSASLEPCRCQPLTGLVFLRLKSDLVA